MNRTISFTGFIAIWPRGRYVDTLDARIKAASGAREIVAGCTRISEGLGLKNSLEGGRPRPLPRVQRIGGRGRPPSSVLPDRAMHDDASAKADPTIHIRT